MALEVEMEDLARCRSQRRPTLDVYHVRFAPHQPGDTLRARARAYCREKGFHHGPIVKRAEPRVNEQAKPRYSLVSFLFQQLVVCGTTPEAGRQRLLEDANHIAVEHIH